MKVLRIWSHLFLIRNTMERFLVWLSLNFSITSNTSLQNAPEAGHRFDRWICTFNPRRLCFHLYSCVWYSGCRSVKEENIHSGFVSPFFPIFLDFPDNNSQILIEKDLSTCPLLPHVLVLHRPEKSSISSHLCGAGESPPPPAAADRYIFTTFPLNRLQFKPAT